MKRKQRIAIQLCPFMRTDSVATHSGNHYNIRKENALSLPFNPLKRATWFAVRNAKHSENYNVTEFCKIFIQH